MRLETIFGLTGRTALVTGSSRGIGAAIAEGLAGAGARVIVHGSRPDAAAETLARIRATGGEVFEIDAISPHPARAVTSSSEPKRWGRSTSLSSTQARR
jgi:NAD(P)-dependent dehydrogenase (short-subunit alcohol dehydrogenase family)